MDPLAPEPSSGSNLLGKGKMNLFSEHTREVVSTLVLWELKDSTVEGKVRRGVVSAVAKTFHLHENTI